MNGSCVLLQVACWSGYYWMNHSVISWPSRHLLQYTAFIHLWFLQHWAPIAAGSWSAHWLWNFKVPKHVEERWVSIHWRIIPLLGFSFTLRKCMVQNAKYAYILYLSHSVCSSHGFCILTALSDLCKSGSFSLSGIITCSLISKHCSGHFVFWSL
jgi:hypothetical protein